MVQSATRKRALLSSGAVLAAVALAAVVLVNLNSPAEGRLRHDDTVRTTNVEKVWTVERARFDRCLTIRFKGDLSGNATPTWGITGPTTVWENLRVHDTDIRVDFSELRSDGRCGDRVPVRRVVLAQQWRTDGGQWRGGPNTRITYRRTSDIDHDGWPTIHLQGGSYDRGDSYEGKVAVYVEPSWRPRPGVSVSDAIHVESTVELSAG